VVDTNKSVTLRWVLTPTSEWYDFLITVQNEAGFENRFAGHLENGQNSFSDPLMGGLI
jgi:phospholipase C